MAAGGPRRSIGADRRFRHRILLAAVACLVVAATAPRASAQARPAPCEVPGVGGTVLCTKVSVPENWRAPPEKRGVKRPPVKRIDLHVVILPAESRDPARAPLYELAGGPGVPGTGAAAFYANEGRIHRLHRDVVLIDPRGTGRSNPLRCPALEAQDPFTGMYPPEAVRRCRAELARVANLAHYTTRDIVRDVDAVRAALGHPRIDIAALSYGTRVAQHYARRYPNRVHAMALFGTVPDGMKLPLWHARNAQSVADRVVAACLGDVLCRVGYPGLQASWRSAQETLHGKPRAEAFRSILASAPGLALVPGVVTDFARGNEQPLRDLAKPGGGFIAEGLYLSVTCAEDTSFIEPREVAAATQGTFLGAYRIDQQVQACKLWRVPRVATPRARPSRVPAVFIAGELDHVTPVEWARTAARGFPVSRVIEVKGMGHVPEGLEGMECIDEVLARFYERPDPAKLDLECISRMRAPAFKLPGQGKGP